MTRPKTIAIMGARGGSKGLPRKNVLTVGGKPLMAHTIEHAKASGVCDAVVVSTEDAEIADIARRYGAEVIERPPELATDQIPAEPVVQHALATYEARSGITFDIVVYLQITDVFRKPEIIRECVERLAANPELDSVFSAYETHKNFWKRSPNGGYERVWRPTLEYKNRQGAEHLYREDTGVACATRAPIVRSGRRIGPRVDLVITEDFRTSIDIHSAFDLWLADKVMTEWKGEA
jgi:CMP-N-acetylneuraminic acid synthetase